MSAIDCEITHNVWVNTGCIFPIELVRELIEVYQQFCDEHNVIGTHAKYEISCVTYIMSNRTRIETYEEIEFIYNTYQVICRYCEQIGLQILQRKRGCLEYYLLKSEFRRMKVVYKSLLNVYNLRSGKPKHYDNCEMTNNKNEHFDGSLTDDECMPDE
jgi:hypothetical protein